VFKGACHNGNINLRGAVQFNDSCRLAQGGAGGHDVIDEQYAPGAEVGLALKRAAHVAGSFFHGEFGLRRGGATADQGVTIHWQFLFAGNATGNFYGLIEAAFTQALGVEWYAGSANRIQLVIYLAGDKFGSPFSDSNLVSIFIGVNDAVDGEFIAKNCPCLGESRGGFEAGTATFAVRGLFAALRTELSWQGWQVGSAGTTQQRLLAIAAAQ
jgi:hypothetical protein